MLGQLTVAIAFLFAIFQHSDGSFFDESTEMFPRESREVPSNMESLGCFSISNTQGAAAFKNVYFSKRYSNKKLKNQDPVEICANKTAAKNVELMGVQLVPINKKKTKLNCRRGLKSKQQLWVDSSECQEGVGGPSSVFAYSPIDQGDSGMLNQCVSHGKTYNEGDKMKIPNDYGQQPSNAMCQECECRDGNPTLCEILYSCESEMNGLQNCEKYSVASGECCPSCECVNKGKKVEKDTEWVKVSEVGEQSGFKTGRCAQFKCQGNGRAIVLTSNKVLCFSCKNPQKNSCCEAICNSK